jgi:hypothetical protein
MLPSSRVIYFFLPMFSSVTTKAINATTNVPNWIIRFIASCADIMDLTPFPDGVESEPTTLEEPILLCKPYYTMDW